MRVFSFIPLSGEPTDTAFLHKFQNGMVAPFFQGEEVIESEYEGPFFLSATKAMIFMERNNPNKLFKWD